MWGFTTYWMWGYTAYWMWGFTAYWMWGFTAYWIWGFTANWMWGFMDDWMWGFTGYWIVLGFTDWPTWRSYTEKVTLLLLASLLLEKDGNERPGESDWLPISQKSQSTFETFRLDTTLSGRAGSALVCHNRGHVFESRLLQQVLRYAGSVNGVQPMRVGWECDQSNWSTVSEAIVRSWLWSTATRSSPLG